MIPVLLIAFAILLVGFLLFLVVALFRRNLLSLPSTYQSRIFTGKRPSFTAELVCIFRAIGNELALCSDPIAYEFCDLDAKLLCQFVVLLRRLLGRNHMPLWNVPFLAVRTVKFDEFIAQSKCERVVILGAGLDARSYRLSVDGQDQVKFFEVDAPASQALKKEKVREVFSKAPELFTNSAYREGRVAYVSCDFASKETSFMDQLINVGNFDPTNPNTVVLLEGVASYLTLDELRRTLLIVSTTCAPGTRFAMNMIEGQDLITKSTSSRILKSVIGEEWKLALKKSDTAEDLFAPLGFKILRDITFAHAMSEVPGLALEKQSKLTGRMMFMQVIKLW